MSKKRVAIILTNVHDFNSAFYFFLRSFCLPTNCKNMFRFLKIYMAHVRTNLHCMKASWYILKFTKRIDSMSLLYLWA